jgi:hypothetical protein
MMNDRFAAQLRQHLLATADERPAEGQLATLNAGLAVTTQRRPIVARLLWNPGRFGPFPSTALRYGLVALALVGAIAGAALLGAGMGRSMAFEGTWTSIDPDDGSTQNLVVGGGTSPTVLFVDEFATGDGCLNDAVKRFTAEGTGEISGNRLDVSFPDGGGCGLKTVGVPIGHLDYDAASDSLIDGQGLGWVRVGGGIVPATRAPVPSPTPRPSPRPGEATFTSTIHGISIDYPSGWQIRPATEPWTGGELTFDSPEADVIFDPELGDLLYLILASQRYGCVSLVSPRLGCVKDRNWREGVLAWMCPGAPPFGEFWSWTVDGFRSDQFGCSSGSLISTGTRGYLIRLVASSDEPGLAETYDWDWLMPMLGTVDLRPVEPVD